MAYLTQQRRAQRKRQAGHNPLAAPLMVFAGVVVIAAFYVAYVLWPRWPEAPVALNAPSLPIVVSGVNFNVEPAAIREAIERRPGTSTSLTCGPHWCRPIPPPSRRWGRRSIPTSGFS
jgi:cytochrome b